MGPVKGELNLVSDTVTFSTHMIIERAGGFLIWYDAIWYDVVWYDIVWYCMISHDII